jgi:hypothetical protein
LPSINPASARLLRPYAQQIERLIAGPVRLRSRPTMNYVLLGLVVPGQVAGLDDLLKAKVLESRGLEEMFEYAGGSGSTFREVLEVVDGSLERHSGWIAEMAEVVSREVRRQRGPVPFGKFATPDGSRFFRPVMRKVEEDGGGVVHRIELVFGEHLSGTVGNPDELQLMEAALRLTARFRAELLDRFRTAASPQDVLSAQRVLERIGRESHDEGFRDRDLMLQLFEGEERQRVNAMYDNWEKFRNPQGEGRLDQAFAKRDPTQLRTCVREIREMTRAFMISATRRYAEMVAGWAF